MSYNAIAISEQVPRGRCSATITITGSSFTVTTETITKKWSLHELTIDPSATNSSQVFFSSKKQQDFSVFTRDKSILKNEYLLNNSNTQKELKKVKRSFRLNSTIVGAMVVGLLAIIVSLFAFKDQLVWSIANQIPFEYEYKLGEQVAEAHLSSNNVIEDDSLVATFQEIIQPLLNVVDEDYEFQFYIIENDIPNAYALPGGFIFVHTGLINEAMQWDEVQGVLAHEIAHVTEKHHIRGVLSQFGLMTIIGSFFGDASQVYGLVVGLGMQLESMAYSRSFETEADTKGWEYLIKANIDPEGLIMFFAKIGDGHDHDLSDKMMNYLSTHPMPEKRVEYLSEKLDALPSSDYFQPTADFDLFKERMNRIIGADTDDLETIGEEEELLDDEAAALEEEITT